MPEAHSQRRADARDDVHEEQQLSEGEGKQFLREVVYHRADKNARYAFRNRNLRDGFEQFFVVKILRTEGFEQVFDFRLRNNGGVEQNQI